MSNEEDSSLRDLVSQTLDARGVLPKLRAELRANVFLALEETQDLKDTLLYNNELRAFAKTADGPIILNLVREFLEFFNLDFTLAVFNPESRCNIDYNQMKREDLLKKLPLGEVVNQKMPLLCQVLERTRAAGFRKDAEEILNVPSPVGLNSTYVKDDASVMTTPGQPDEKAQTSEVEEVSVISTESISEMSPKGDGENRSSGDESSPELSRSGRVTPTNEKPDESFNLLVFTPVQQVKTVPKTLETREKTDQSGDRSIETDKPETGARTNGTTLKPDVLTNGGRKEVPAANEKSSSSGGKRQEPVANENTALHGARKEERGSSFLLNDLPPLTASLAAASKHKDMTEIRKLLESAGDSNSSVSSASGKENSKSAGTQPDTAHDSDETIAEDDEINDLLQSHASSDGQLTIDETISKLTNHSEMDHVESV